ncbi:hypothetical protein [Novipirellula aureliae]|uniref:hypothetical protein n=1 Tax=Novipirellula aureliae TaxID=2527966 RepID=UPI0011B853CD|nr:hypothetical protein [Novipirellula aureliae]
MEVLRAHSLLQRTIAEIDDSSLDDWLHASLSGLCDHIEQTHHEYLKNTFPTLTRLIADVVGTHGDADAELGELQDYFVGWRSEILNVMATEERDLFPAIRTVEEARSNKERSVRTTISANCRCRFGESGLPTDVGFAAPRRDRYTPSRS